MYFHSQLAHAATGLAALAMTAVALSSTAHAGVDASGIWYDHNGRGAVEIKPCASNSSRLCGHVVYVKKARHKKRCGTQIIGNVRSNGRGWIYSPTRGRSFPLSVKRLSANKLRIVGNAGSRFFSKTYIWKRAPDSIVNCGQAVIAEKKIAPPVKQAAIVDKTVVKKATPQQIAVNQPANSNPATDSAETYNSASAALIATTESAAAETPKPDPVAVTQSDTQVDDLSPPGGLSTGGDDKLSQLSSIISKFTSGEGLKSFKGKGKCRFRIPYVGRTIRVPCK